MEDNSILVPVTLANGTEILVEATPRGRAQVSDIKALPFSGLVETIEGIAADIGSAIVRATPTKASVEIGVEVAVESGKLTALLVKGSTKGNLTIKFEWERSTAGR
jgi:hypothetical protein